MLAELDGFNEAAASMQRKIASEPGSRSSPATGFNEAAASMPRKISCVSALLRWRRRQLQ